MFGPDTSTPPPYRGPYCPARAIRDGDKNPYVWLRFIPRKARFPSASTSGWRYVGEK